MSLPAPYYQEDGITIYHGDCREILPELKEKVDLVLTDPPYSEHVHSNGRRGARNGAGDIVGEVKNFGFEHLEYQMMPVIAANIERLVKRWILVFSDIESCPAWKQACEYVGLEYIRTGAWVKIAPTPQFTGDRPAAGFEAITIFHPSGRKQWNGGGRAAVWTYCAHGGERDVRYHPAQKPINLILRLLQDFSDEGDIILDPFLGSGTTAVAAKRLGRKCIGIEISEKYCELAVDRLRQMELF